MKIINITENVSLSFGAWDGVCYNSKTRQNNIVYTETWIGKVKYEYIEGLICIMYVFCFFRILKYNKRRVDEDS